MGIDIKELRKDQGGDPDKVRESCKKRFQDPKIIESIIQQDETYRKHLFNMEQTKKEYNTLGREIGERKKKDKTDQCADLLEKKTQFEEQIKVLEKEVTEMKDKLDKDLGQIGNIIADDVKVAQDEELNEVVSSWGNIDKDFVINETKGHAQHHQIMTLIDGYDPVRGRKIVGHRGYFLKNYGVLLNQALINFGINFLMKKGYDVIQPPFFMKKEIMEETCQLSDFEENLYKVIRSAKGIGGAQEEQKVDEVQGKPKEEPKKKDQKEADDDDDETKDKEYYLIATSEQPISAMHRNETLDIKENTAIQYCGISSCFRKEAGKHGKDTRGIFRIHQFEKVEQFVLCRPEDSKKYHEQMRALSEEFLQALEIPYRIVNIVSGALNDAAAKKYDIEGWFPGFKEYKELMSISNCTDYQSRALNIRCGFKQQQKGKKEESRFIHMLNGTLCATERTICCILENNQTPEGIRVPKALVPYVGTELIPYICDFPKKEEESTKKKDKK